MGYVETLPSGRYRGVPWNAAAGKRGKSRSFDRWAEADAYWRRTEAETDGDYSSAGIAVTRQQRGIPTFAEHVIEWAIGGIEDGELSTIRDYQSQARILAQRWPTQRVDEITELMIRGYLAELRDAGASPSTRTLRLTVQNADESDRGYGLITAVAHAAGLFSSLTRVAMYASAASSASLLLPISGIGPLPSHVLIQPSGPLPDTSGQEATRCCCVAT